MKQTAIVLVGLPGSGKSTYLNTILDYMADNTFVYSTDQYISDFAVLHEKSYDEVFQEMVGEAHEVMNELVVDARDSNLPIVWDQTNLNSGKRKKIISLLGQNYDVSCYYFDIFGNNTKEWRERLQNRPGKTIPESVINSMIDKFDVPKLSEGFVEIRRFNIFGELLDVQTPMEVV